MSLRLPCLPLLGSLVLALLLPSDVSGPELKEAFGARSGWACMRACVLMLVACGVDRMRGVALEV